MSIIPLKDNIEEYLKQDNVIDYNNVVITQIADSLYEKAHSETEFIKSAYICTG